MEIEFKDQLPPMLTGDSLKKALAYAPDYPEEIRLAETSERLIALSSLYDIYVPSPMSEEIYSKLYLALLRSLHKKTTILSTVQRNENYRLISGLNHNSVLGGADSFTIIGTSGVGKSTAINKSIDLLSRNGVISCNDPYMKIIPCLVVQCPFDSSSKGLIYEILRKIDELLGSNYYKNATKSRLTTDMLIGSVCQIAVNHIGLLIIDEIQNIINSNHGSALIALLTQIINSSGISIGMVGTPECETFFEREIWFSRRSLGLQYPSQKNDKFFYDFCYSIFQRQYTKEKTVCTDSIVQWLYDHSAGIISIVVSLIHDAQEIAILNGYEKLDMYSLNEAYNKRIGMMYTHIQKQKLRSVLSKPQLPTQKNTNTIVTEASNESSSEPEAKGEDTISNGTSCDDLNPIPAEYDPSWGPVDNPEEYDPDFF